MSSAQLDILPFEEVEAGSGMEAASELRQVVAARVAAHRARKTQATRTAGQQRGSEGGPSNPIAATVAARYAQSPTYRAFLAEEARRAMERADAAAEVAARNAEAVAAVQLQLLDELRTEGEAAVVRTGSARRGKPATVTPIASAQAQPVAQPEKLSGVGLTVRLHEEVGRGPVEPGALKSNAVATLVEDEAAAEEAQALDAEIAFRQAPVFEELPPMEETVPLPANLLAFPRQLVAATRARPRVAEGPLREDLYDGYAVSPASPLRIFEVAQEIAQEIAQEAAPAEEETVEPEWSSIWLDTPTEQPLHVDSAARVALPVMEPIVYEAAPVVAAAVPVARVARVETLARPVAAGLVAPTPIQAAYFSHRALAAAMDFALIFGGVLASVTAFALATDDAAKMPLREAELVAAAMFAAFYVVYHLLFFTLSDGTPGMRFARIGLCTFDDDNPTRAQLRRRMWASVAAACPLGLGFLWALVDEDGLGWHDRLSRMYQRSY